jgi:hypothetical protein
MVLLLFRLGGSNGIRHLEYYNEISATGGAEAIAGRADAAARRVVLPGRRPSILGA